MNICVVLLISVLVSGCASLGNSGTTSEKSRKHAAPVPTAMGVIAPVCRLPSCTNLNPLPGVSPFTDTWENIHRFQTFDYDVTDFVDIAKNNDFIWGAHPSNVTKYRSINPHIMLSYYIMLRRDNGPTFRAFQARSLEYWKQVHPDWIAYKCDRKTPAYEDYNNGSREVPFMLNNPAMRAWQIDTYIKPASDFGYDALAVDNVNMENLFGACGYYDTNGNWVQRYTGKSEDPQWQVDVVSWVTHMQQVVHSLPNPMLMIINFSFGSVLLDSDLSEQILAHTDGVLDEMGFTHYGEYNLSGKEWLQLARFMDQMQRQNKPFFSINQFQHGITRDGIQWALASYLMGKQRLAMVHITQLGGYGRNRNFPEYSIPIGSPQSEMYFSQNVYWRDYTKGKVIVNPSDRPFIITLLSSESYVDPYGTYITTSLSLPAKSGKILLNVY